TLAQHAARPSHLATTLAFSLMLAQLRRDGPGTQAQAEAAVALTSKHGLETWLAMSTILRGWALVEQGHVAEGMAQMRQGMAAYRATGAALNKSYHLALLAEAYAKAGQTTEGLVVLAEALAAVEQSGERWYEAELYRLTGALTVQQLSVVSCQLSVKSRALKSLKSKVVNPQSAFRNPQLEAEACFQQAIEIARRQEAKLFELRATVSLARLWQQQSKGKEAHARLTEIYGWFTEGFDTKDLQEAHTVLAELGAVSE
ncbi:MAG: hypothetical protein ACRERD_13615, partial [Candidatus Binatia bacterium]